LSRKIVISADPYEARAALLDGDLLTNLEIESAGSNRRKGNLYKGRVTTVEKSLDAAFVDYGMGKDGFLPLDEVNERSLIELTGKSGGASGHVSLGAGDIVLVQVAKEEVGKKGAALTMNVSNPGRFLVLMPFSTRTGVSRKLAGDDRLRLKDSLDHLELPKGFGCIIRTVSDQSQETELQADLDHLVAQWQEIVDRFREAKKPGEVHQESSLALRFVRDYMDTDVDEVIVEDDTTWRELNGYFNAVMPGRSGHLTRYSGDLPLFVRFNVDRQVESLLKNRVTLPSGGSIVIGQTEALTAIDVNSGRTKKGAIEDTAYKTNVEAAVEIARQVILRDIGGIIVVDFIDMESESHRHSVEDTLRNALSRDKARLTVSKIRDFGLLAFSRQRLRHTVEEGIMSACPACGGTGRIRAPGPLAMSILRRLRERIANMTADAELVEVTVSIEVANFLNNRKREELIALEKRHGMTIEILGTPDVTPDDMQITIHEEIPDDRQISRPRSEMVDDVYPGPGTTAPAMETSREQPAAAPMAPPPPKPKPSLLRGLLARLLDIDEFDEVPRKPTPAKVAPAPVRAPAPAPVAPAPVRTPAPIAAEKPAEAAQAPARPPRQPRPPRPPREPRAPQERRPRPEPRQEPRQEPRPEVKPAPAPKAAPVTATAPEPREAPMTEQDEGQPGQTGSHGKSRNARRRAAQRRAREAAAMAGTDTQATGFDPESAMQPVQEQRQVQPPVAEPQNADAVKKPRQRRPRVARPKVDAGTQAASEMPHATGNDRVEATARPDRVENPAGTEFVDGQPAKKPAPRRRRSRGPRTGGSGSDTTNTGSGEAPKPSDN